VLPNYEIHNSGQENVSKTIDVSKETILQNSLDMISDLLPTFWEKTAYKKPQCVYVCMCISESRSFVQTK
jgi:hypothetical protein